MGHKLTKAQLKRELLKCGRDPVYFINNYVKVAHPMKGLIPFNLYPFQETCVGDFKDHRFNIILKARQLGMSTTTAAYIGWLILFHRNKNVVVMATKLSTASNLVKKVKLAMKSLPEWMMISKITIDNRNSFELDNGSQVKSISTSGDAGRSEALSLLVIDEAAIIEGLDHLWAGLYPTLSTGGDCIVLSTPKGVGNMFHKLYSEAEQELNDFNPIKLPWDVHPERDAAWFEKETRNMKKTEIAQELLCNFNMSGATLVDGEDLENIFKMCSKPKYKTGYDRNLWIWEQFSSDGSYFLVADPARGDGADYSAIHVFDSKTMNQAAEYQGKLPLDMFANLIMDVSKEYGSCLTVVENNSIGLSVITKLQELGHPNLYWSRKTTHEQVDSLLAEDQTGVVCGFTNTVKTRPLIIAKLEEFIRNRVVKVNSIRLANELKTFIWKDGKAQAMRSYNDDLVMACAISCWIRDTALVANAREAQYSKAMISAFTTKRSTLNTSITGMKNTEQRVVIKNKNEKVINLPFFIG
jgi:hypothetical protein